MAQHGFIVVRHGGFGNAGDFGDDAFNLVFADFLLAVFRLRDALGCACFVNNINRFIGQESLVDVFCRQLCGSLKSIVGVMHVVVRFKHRL